MTARSGASPPQPIAKPSATRLRSMSRPSPASTRPASPMAVAVESDPRQFAVIGSRLFLFRTAENRQQLRRRMPRLLHSSPRRSGRMSTLRSRARTRPTAQSAAGSPARSPARRAFARGRDEGRVAEAAARCGHNRGKAPSSVSTIPPAAERIASPAAMSHSIVWPHADMQIGLARGDQPELYRRRHRHVALRSHRGRDPSLRLVAMEAADQRRPAPRPGQRAHVTRSASPKASPSAAERLREGMAPGKPEPSELRGRDRARDRPAIADDGDRDAIAVAAGQELARAVERIEQDEDRRRARPPPRFPR
jgi:hypothetical protein